MSELDRYQRHIALPEVGLAGQEKLKAARVLIVGAGGLGSPAALYLAAAGVGQLGIIDDDRVDRSNLQRQILHGEDAIGSLKVDSARSRLTDLNPTIDVQIFPCRIDRANALSIIASYDVIIDGTDNLPSRYLLNDACRMSGKPLIYGSVHRFEGQVSVFRQGSGCYRCLYPQPPPPGAAPDCSAAGVLGVLPGLVGTIQATEALKLLLGIGDALAGRLLLIDALTMRFREVEYKSDPACPVCGPHPTIRTLIDYDAFCRKNWEMISMKELTPRELKKRLDAKEKLMVVDVREPHELAVARLPGTCDIPLGQILSRMNELDQSRDVVVMCRSGGRSARAIEELQKAGYHGTLINLKGGILAWSDEVDPAIRKY